MNKPIFRAHNINVEFMTGHGKGRARTRACRDVSLTIDEGEIVGLVGESGSGKTTFARAAAGIQSVDSGEMYFRSELIPARRPRSLVRQIQMVFQDPYSSLEPTMTIYQSLAELIRANWIVESNLTRSHCVDLMTMVQLPPELLDSRPHSMSGGQRQRVAIAKALALKPSLLIADEAVSALDVSVQAGIINLLLDLRSELDLSILFIAHDLAVVRALCDRASVIFRGEIVEEGYTQELFVSPKHQYTRKLIDSVPTMSPRK